MGDPERLEERRPRVAHNLLAASSFIVPIAAQAAGNPGVVEAGPVGVQHEASPGAGEAAAERALTRRERATRGLGVGEKKKEKKEKKRHRKVRMK